MERMVTRLILRRDLPLGALYADSGYTLYKCGIDCAHFN
jgi:hypothetical protein